MNFEFFGKTVSGGFTIPSGIVTTQTPIMQYFMDRVPEVGIITTKSIGPEPRPGYREPVLSQYAKGCFVNAVGLTNPGARASVEQLAALNVPADRFLLTSIFAGSVEEFVEVARLLAPVSDGLELNLSCPHAKGYGMAMGQDPDLVREICGRIRDAVDLPVIAKLTPNAPNIGEIAQAAVSGGADGICAINTVGPGLHTAFGSPVLSNGLGGMSGKGVLPIGLKCVQEIAQAVDVPIIGCGGVSSAADVRAYRHAGASVVGVGSALVGMTTDDIADYFQTLSAELEGEDASAESLVRYDEDMAFYPVTLERTEKVADDIAVLTFDRDISICAGEFLFLWVPGLGEKPFSALDDAPFKLAVIDVGEFTHALMDLPPGTQCYVRGPHGIAAAPPDGMKIVAVAGGTGLAAVYQLVRDAGGGEVFVGARTADRLYYESECERCANVHVATDDGSRGFHGLVTEALDTYLQGLDEAERAELVFYNCGPAPMVKAAEVVQGRYVSGDRIFSAIDYLTKCGVGICGACASPDGRRLCVDGPFLSAGT